MEALITLSRFYGNNPEYVLGGGGNTSWKDGDTLYVKGSGSSLAEACADSFVKMDRKALALIWEKTYPESGEQRESAVLADMMAARKAGEEQKRPSVEALLHDILPFAFVVHLHPALVNGLTCSQQGEKAVREIFNDDVIWIPSTNPGYILSSLVKTAMGVYYEKHRKFAPVIFLQNHGVFVGADSADGIKELYGEIMSKISDMITRKPDFSDEKRVSACVNAAAVDTQNPIDIIARTLAELAGGIVVFMTSGEITALLKNRSSFYPVSGAFTPDHIVYAGSDPLFCEDQTVEGIRRAWKDHAQKTGRNPKIIAVQGIGIFSVGATEKAANLALDLFRDTVKVAVYAESFGGPLFMTADKIDFINNWEVERFRSSVSTK
jgi:rhamnose utilization protein RhaD (predicted bifunctional aldolase and dehydrogenase)